MVGLLLIGIGGLALLLTTVWVRVQAGSDVRFLLGLWLLATLALGLSVWRSWPFLNHLWSRTLRLKVLESGLIELESRIADKGKESEIEAKAPRDFMQDHQDSTMRYGLASNSLFWPGLFVLRLVPVDEPLDPSAPGQPGQNVAFTIIALKNNLSATAYHALARLMLWVQRKGAQPSQPGILAFVRDTRDPLDWRSDKNSNF